MAAAVGAKVLHVASTTLAPVHCHSRPVGSVAAPQKVTVVSRRRASYRPRAFCSVNVGAGRAPVPGRVASAAAKTAENAETAENAQSAEEEQRVEDDVESSSNGAEVPSAVANILVQYREAIQAGDEEAIKVAEAQVVELEEQRSQAAESAASLTQELNQAKDRLLRLNADFDNFRKRSEREKLSLASNVRGDVIEDLLPMIDNFERAKGMLKAETEAELKIDNSYQGIYKQFVEIMKKLGVSAVETVGAPFDPNFHEAIMQEESTEFEEGIVTQEFRKGFKIADKVLRPAMVKVSAGPGAGAGAASEESS